MCIILIKILSPFPKKPIYNPQINNNTMKPLIVINLKAYETGTGKKALNLAKLAEDISISTGSKFIFCVQPADIFMISSKVKIPIYAQHIDPIDYGSNTGYILPESVKSAGARGTLLNLSLIHI